MLHTYRKVEFFSAEQFDGSAEMAKKYNLKPRNSDTWYIPSYNFCNFIFKGDWLVTDEDGFLYVVSEDDFEDQYERWD
ncbi:MAG: hypothetical protein ACLRX6_03400 [Limosilactobacillus pontis]|uniref:hypothetical protein n=1 Tax=Limosilactobacillus pontis TaxID=35787 RepID=UPI0039A3EC54